jgi:flavin-dependent dehydrogenase
VEATDQGWFYSAQFTLRDAVVCFMTDADLYAANVRRDKLFWSRQLAKTTHTQKEFGDGQVVFGPSIAAASTSIRCDLGDRNWMAIGDAAMSYDPLSSLGITKALDSGMNAAEAIIAFQNGREDALLAWPTQTERTLASYLETWKKYYGLEQRWPNSEFWARRQRYPDNFEQPFRCS